MKKSTILSVFISLSILLLGSFMAIYGAYENNITGNDIAIPTRVNILPAIPSPCAFHLYEGWNLVSFYCLGLFNPTPDVALPLNASAPRIFFYDQTQSTWKSYNPSLPAWTVQRLENVDRLKGYWVYVTPDVDYYHDGYKKSSAITLNPGWNLIGYPSITSKQINDSLNGIAFTVIEGFDNIGKTFLIYINGSNTSSLNILETYKGYWINSSASQTWNVYGS